MLVGASLENWSCHLNAPTSSGFMSVYPVFFVAVRFLCVCCFLLLLLRFTLSPEQPAVHC
eukprot:m.13670 g.13670  ORF g.13670 m.13670 type:complete len:60 (+) comp5977_c0_seq1:13557-13736(+)